MKFIIGKKIEMTQIWQNDQVVAVTKVQAGPCTVVQLKDKKNDGYEAVQISYGEQKEKRMKKPQLGHLKKAGIKARYLKEFRSEAADLKIGDKIDVSTFVVGDIIKVVANSKGKGFQGVVRRHGFSGQDATHGNKDQLRMPGSIGAGGPQHVFKGKKMAGRMGGGQITTQNLKIVEIDKDNNILLIKGAIPGGRNGLVLISGKGELKITEPQIVEEIKLTSEVELIEEKKVDDIIVENIEEKSELKIEEVEPVVEQKIETEVK